MRAWQRPGSNGEDTMSAHDEPKLIFPALAGLYQRFSPFSYAFMRFATGAVLVPHGIQKVLNVPIAKFAPNIAAKGLPFAEGLAYLTYFAESVAAACLAIGLLTRIAAAMIGIEMLVIVFFSNGSSGTSGQLADTSTPCCGCCSALPSSSRAVAAIR